MRQVTVATISGARIDLLLVDMSLSQDPGALITKLVGAPQSCNRRQRPSWKRREIPQNLCPWLA
jgi:hypothetical protein